MAEHEETAEHWDSVYATKDIQTISWHQENPVTSLRLIGAPRSTLVDVGAGASRLADHLLAQGWERLTLLDVSATGLDVTRRRLGDAASSVCFVVSDLLAWEPSERYDVWHDRAVLHFLTAPADRARYAELAARTVVSGGHLVIGGFAPDGPDYCSGLHTAGRSPEQLAEELAGHFSPVHAELEAHATPAGVAQSFAWVVLQRT